MVTAIHFDWSKNWNESEGEWIMNIRCPNTDHHEKFGRGWETAYESTTPANGEEGETCEPYQGCPCCEDDSGDLAPMMNYLYPLDYKGMIEEESFDEEATEKNKQRRIKIASETNCVAVENLETGDWFLALTGGGMDLSPSIAYAYFIAQKWLPAEFLIQDIKAGWCKDSLSKEHFEELKAVVIQQLANEKSRIDEQLKSWDKPTKEISQ